MQEARRALFIQHAIGSRAREPRRPKSDRAQRGAVSLSLSLCLSLCLSPSLSPSLSLSVSVSVSVSLLRALARAVAPVAGAGGEPALRGGCCGPE